MITEFNTLPKKIYYVQTAEGCTVLDADGAPLAEITAPGGYFPGIGSADASTGTVTFSPAVKRVIGPFDLAPQLQLTLLGLLGGDLLPAGYTRMAYLESTGVQYLLTPLTGRSDTQIEIKMQNLPLQTNAAMYLLGVNSRQYDTWSWGAFGTLHENYGYLWTGGYGTAVYDIGLENGDRYDVHIYSIKERQILSDGMTLRHDGWNRLTPITEPVVRHIILFGANYVTPRYFAGRIFWFKGSSEEDNVRCDYVAALDAKGRACMFDRVSREPIYNSDGGDFILGVDTQQQLNSLLLRLPDRTGQEVGALQVRLAASLQTPENEAKLEELSAKNWEITQAA